MVIRYPLRRDYGQRGERSLCFAHSLLSHLDWMSLIADLEMSLMFIVQNAINPEDTDILEGMRKQKKVLVRFSSGDAQKLSLETETAILSLSLLSDAHSHILRRRKLRREILFATEISIPTDRPSFLCQVAPLSPSLLLPNLTQSFRQFNQPSTTLWIHLSLITPLQCSTCLRVWHRHCFPAISEQCGERKKSGYGVEEERRMSIFGVGLEGHLRGERRGVFLSFWRLPSTRFRGEE